jgi:hypothetical protein
MAFTSATKVLFGIHQQFHVLPFTVDRTNLFTGKIEMHVYEAWNEPNSSYMSLSFGNSVGGQAGISSLAEGPAYTPPMCVGVERRYDDASSMAIYSYTFEGIATEHSVRYVEYELEFTLEQAPIEGHPNFQNINDIYGPYDSINRLWPPFITEKAAAVGLKAQTSSGQMIQNPMYGVTSYLIPGAIYRTTFTDPDVDKTFMDNVGAIDEPSTYYDKMFSQFSQLLSKKIGNRNWLKLAPKVRQRGSCLTITEEWQLSGYRGWLEPVYSPDALAGHQL